MSEVITFERGRRPADHRFGGEKNKNTVEFFNRRELNQILQVYSRRVMSGEWLDYALGYDDGGAVFAIYGGSYSAPLYSIAKRPRNQRRQAGRYQVAARGRVLKTDQSLTGVLKVLDAQKPKLVKGA
jgi:hypothetical protein